MLWEVDCELHEGRDWVSVLFTAADGDQEIDVRWINRTDEA